MRSWGPDDKNHTVDIVRIVWSLLLLDSAIIVDKDESALVLGIGIALSALVSGAQIAGGIVRGKRGFGRAFLLSPLSPSVSFPFPACQNLLTAKGAWFCGERPRCRNHAEGYICGERCRRGRFRPFRYEAMNTKTRREEEEEEKSKENRTGKIRGKVAGVNWWGPERQPAGILISTEKDPVLDGRG